MNRPPVLALALLAFAASPTAAGDDAPSLHVGDACPPGSSRTLAGPDTAHAWAATCAPLDVLTDALAHVLARPTS